jgi:predicted Zn-dependent peptidase
LTRTFEVHRGEVDGVPAFWADTPPGPFVGTLMFRVGRSDEPGPLGGITHLVEHLALAPLGQQEYDHNGFTDPNRAFFVSSGDPEEVSIFLETVAANLSTLPLDRLLLERRIIAQEEDQAGPSIGGAIRWYRFGMTNHGRVGEEQAALGWVGPQVVADWAARTFNRQNAALVLSGPPPAGLKLQLPDGERLPSAPIEPVPDITYPSHVGWDGPGTTLSMIIRRATHATVLGSIVDRRARQKLRFERGLVYDVVSDYDPLDVQHALMIVGSDCPPERVAEVSTILLEVLDDLSTNGPTKEELVSEAVAFKRQFNDRDAQIGFLDQLAENYLLGGDVPDPDVVLERREALEPGTVAEALREAMDGLMLLAAGEARDPRFHPYSPWSAGIVSGTEAKPAGRHFPGRGPKERLVLGSDGVSFVASANEALTVRFADCVLVQHVGSTGRLLWGRDGFRVAMEATDWNDGQRILDAIDRAIPPELVACAEHGVGGLEDPDETEAAAS